MIKRSDNAMEALEFELIAHALAQRSCPLLQTLDLSSKTRILSLTKFS